MKASQLRVGSIIRSDEGAYVVTSVEHDTDVMTVEVSQLVAFERLFLHPNETVKMPEVAVGPVSISHDIALKIERRLDEAVKRFGPTWSGSSGDLVDSVEEELIDALVYVWAHRRMLEEAIRGHQQQ